MNPVKTALNKLLPKNQFARAVSILVGGTAIAQALQLVASPILTRMYSPESFGLLAVFVSTLGMLSVVASFRYEVAIPLPESDSESRDLVRVSTLILVSISLLSWLILWSGGDLLMANLSLEKLSPFKYFLPAALLLTGLYQIFSNWSVRKKRFIEVSRTEVEKSFAAVAVQFSTFSLGASGLILGQMISSCLGIWRLFRSYNVDRYKSTRFNGFELSELWKVVKRYKQFPLYSMPNGLLNTAGRQLPPILLASAFTPAVAGLYYLANLVTQKPVSLITGANAKVFIAHAPDSYRSGRLGSLFFSVYEQSLKVVTLPLTLVGLVVPRLFGAIFGSEWEGGGQIAAILLPWVLMIALINPVSPVVAIVSRQGVALNFEILLMVLRIGGLFVGIYLNSYITAVALFSGGAVLGILAELLWLASISGAPVRKVFESFLKEIAMAGGLISIAMLTYYFLGTTAFSLFLLICGGMVFYRSGKAFMKGVRLG